MVMVRMYSNRKVSTYQYNVTSYAKSFQKRKSVSAASYPALLRVSFNGCADRPIWVIRVRSHHNEWGISGIDLDVKPCGMHTRT